MKYLLLVMILTSAGCGKSPSSGANTDLKRIERRITELEKIQKANPDPVRQQDRAIQEPDNQKSLAKSVAALDARIKELEKAHAEVVQAIHQRDKFDEERRIEFLKDGNEYKETNNKFVAEIGADLNKLAKRVKALERK